MFGADVDWIEGGSGSDSPTANKRERYANFRVDQSSTSIDDAGGSMDK
jgi:hypothetical protein